MLHYASLYFSVNFDSTREIPSLIHTLPISSATPAVHNVLTSCLLSLFLFGLNPSLKLFNPVSNVFHLTLVAVNQLHTHLSLYSKFKLFENRNVSILSAEMTTNVKFLLNSHYYLSFLVHDDQSFYVFISKFVKETLQKVAQLLDFDFEHLMFSYPFYAFCCNKSVAIQKYYLGMVLCVSASDFSILNHMCLSSTSILRFQKFLSRSIFV